MFLIEYIKHPFKVGALAPSSTYLAKSMVKPIRFKDCTCIIEYGPGTGVFTDELIKHIKADTTLLLIEQNIIFCHELKQKYAHVPNVIICHGDACDSIYFMQKHKIKKAEYIISGLPFASLPKQVSYDILQAASKILGKSGKLIAFQYTLFKQSTFTNYFKIGKIIYELRNLPPAFVLVMANKD